MAETDIQIYSAESTSDILNLLQNVSDLKITGSCTQIEKLPKKMLSICNVKDLKEISRNEQFIDVGAAVTLNTILALGENKLPSILYNAIAKIANPHVRNLATIGGNICSQTIKGTLFAPLLALDAKIFMQTKDNTISIPISKFTSVPEKYIVTKIRIPTDDWDISEFTRLGPEHKLTEDSASYAFLANIENNILTGVRIAFSGTIAFRSVNIENRMVGARIPMEAKTISALISETSIQFDELFSPEKYNQLIKEKFLRLITYSFSKLT